LFCFDQLARATVIVVHVMYQCVWICRRRSEDYWNIPRLSFWENARFAV